jgi:hypothetical protein
MSVDDSWLAGCLKVAKEKKEKKHTPLLVLQVGAELAHSVAALTAAIAATTVAALAAAVATVTTAVATALTTTVAAG